jgi:hypothetical protein
MEIEALAYRDRVLSAGQDMVAPLVIQLVVQSLEVRLLSRGCEAVDSVDVSKETRVIFRSCNHIFNSRLTSSRFFYSFSRPSTVSFHLVHGDPWSQMV